MSHQYSERVVNLIQRSIGIVLVFVFYLHTFEPLLEELLRNAANYKMPYTYIALLITTLLLFFTLPRKGVHITECAGIVASIGIPMLLVIFSANDNSEEISASGIASMLTVAMNILFVVFAGWKIWYSITHLRDKMVFMSGILYLLGWAVSRYLVLFGDYVTTSLIFVGCGVLLYMLNNIWDKSVKKEEKVD